MDELNRTQKTSGNAAKIAAEFDTDIAELESMFAANNKRLETIIEKVERLTKRKKDAWSLGRNLKAELEAKCDDFGKKMLEVGKALQVRSLATLGISESPPQVLEFSEAFSENSADIALCENGDTAAGDSMSSFESGGSAWLTSEVMGLAPSLHEAQIRSKKSSQNTGEPVPKPGGEPNRTESVKSGIAQMNPNSGSGSLSSCLKKPPEVAGEVAAQPPVDERQAKILLKLDLAKSFKGTLSVEDGHFILLEDP